MNSLQVLLCLTLALCVTAIPDDLNKSNFITKTFQEILECIKIEKISIKECVQAYKDKEFDSKPFEKCLSGGACVAKKFDVYNDQCEIQWDEVSKVIGVIPDSYLEEAKKLEGICKEKVSGSNCNEVSKSGLLCITENSEKARELIELLISKLEKHHE